MGQIKSKEKQKADAEKTRKQSSTLGEKEAETSTTR
jgi:hypothetical protein